MDRSLTDRTVHAESDVLEVVRYDRAGKWYLEQKNSDNRQYATLRQAVRAAKWCRRSGGSVYLDLPGGGRFDAMYRSDDV